MIVNPLRIPRRRSHELESNLLLCFTGTTRAGDRIIDDQTRRYEVGNEDALAGLRVQKELAVQMKNALLRGRLTEFGELLGHAWELQEADVAADQHAASSTRPTQRRSTHGALGGKVTGAGGGGFMLFYCRPGTAIVSPGGWRRLGCWKRNSPSDGRPDEWAYVER